MAILVFSQSRSRKLITFLARPSQEDLTALVELMKAGKLKPVIDRRYPLNEAPQAVRYLAEKHARGKVVITWQGSRHI